MSHFKIYFYIFFMSLSVHIFAQIKSGKQDSLTYETFKQKIKDFEKKQDWQRAIDLSNETISKIQMPKWQIKALLLKAHAYRIPGKFEKAIKNLNKALKLAEQYQFKKLRADILFELANVHRDSGQKDAAIDELAQSLVIYESVNDQNDLIKAQILKGIIQNELGDHNKGEATILSAAKNAKKIKNEILLQKAWFALGYGYFTSKNYPKAKIYFLKSLRHTSAEDLLTKNLLWLNLATIYQRLSQLDSAYFYQIKAIKLAEKNKNPYLLATLYYNAATVKFEQKDIDSTRYFALKGLKNAKKVKRFNRQIDNLLILTQVDSVTGDFSNELKRFKQITILKDSILKYERKKIADEITGNYEKYKKDEVIALQQKNLLVAHEKSRLLQYLIIATISIMMILLFWLLTYRKLLKNNKRIYQLEKENIQHQLKQKEHELVAIALQVEQKNKLIDNFYNKLKKSTDETGDNTNINKFLSEVKNSLNIHKDIELFSEKFSQLHHDFNRKLSENYPQLTRKEIKFLSFLKIGLSNKQIATLHNITPAAVHKMRYRIKKKLNLPADTSLDNFITKL